MVINQPKNSIQTSLLKLFDRKIDSKELNEIHSILLKYYDSKIKIEAKKIMSEKNYTQDDLDFILNQSNRSKMK